MTKTQTKNVDADHDRTKRPVVIGQPTGSSTLLNEVDIDFRVSGLPHSVVKQAENSRVRELVKKIKSHPHRRALQADLQQNNAHNPFSEKSKKMIKDMGNVEPFELCETIPKVQCKEWLFLLVSRHRLTALSGISLQRINPAEVSFDGHWIFSQSRTMSLRKGDLVAIAMGRTEEQKEHHIAHNLRKRCIKRGFEGIHDRFQKDSIFCESQNSIDQTEEVSIQIDKDAQKDFTYRMTEDEYFRYIKNWWISSQ